MYAEGVLKMANIKPFKGYRYNMEKVSQMSDVVCPSLYKLTDKRRSELYEMSLYDNISAIRSQVAFFPS